MRYGSDRTRMHEITGKRAVENKDLGPLVKTSMNRYVSAFSEPVEAVLIDVGARLACYLRTGVSSARVVSGSRTRSLESRISERPVVETISRLACMSRR
jgi:hypothetical protein